MHTDGYRFFIVSGYVSSMDDGQGLPEGPRIFKVPPFHPYVEPADGPYLSIRNLKRNSRIYKELERKNAKRARKITEERFIIEPADFILTPRTDEGLPIELVGAIQHCIKGKVKGKSVSGMHYFSDSHMRIVEFLRTNATTGVWEAKVEFYDKRTKKWIEKTNPSTFFPQTWILQRVFDECVYAYFNMEREKVSGKNNVYRTKTKSGVTIYLVIIQEKLKTLYPSID